jgi:hypothetical protein
MSSVPFAVDRHGAWRLAITCEKCDEPFHCWECRAACVLRKGQQRIHHFAHAPSAGNTLAGGCTGGEGAIHKACKLFIKEKVGELIFSKRCVECEEEVVRWHGTSAVCEKAVVAGVQLYRVDVLAQNESDSTEAAIEVLHTHRCSGDKLAALASVFGENVFEVESFDYEEALRSMPLTLSCVNRERCPSCIDRFVAEARRVAEAKRRSAEYEARRLAEERRTREERWLAEERTREERRLAADRKRQRADAVEEDRLKRKKRGQKAAETRARRLQETQAERQAERQRRDEEQRESIVRVQFADDPDVWVGNISCKRKNTVEEVAEAIRTRTRYPCRVMAVGHPWQNDKYCSVSYKIARFAVQPVAGASAPPFCSPLELHLCLSTNDGAVSEVSVLPRFEVLRPRLS